MREGGTFLSLFETFSAFQLFFCVNSVPIFCCDLHLLRKATPCSRRSLNLSLQAQRGDEMAACNVEQLPQIMRVRASRWAVSCCAFGGGGGCNYIRLCGRLVAAMA